MFRKFFLGLLLFSCTNTLAQDKGGVFGQPVMPGPGGVFIFMMDKANAGRAPRPNKTYIISKDADGHGSFKQIAAVKFPASAAALSEKLGPALLSEILQNRKLKSAEDLYRQLTTGRPDTLGLYMMDKRVMLALGMLYIDNTKGNNSNTGYKVGVKENGNTRLLFEKYLQDVAYSPFPEFRLYKTIASDSSVSCTWYAVKGQGTLAEIVLSGGGTKSTRRRFIYRTRDTLFVSFTAAAQPGEHYALFARPMDLAGNKGRPSDTARLIASSMTDAMMLQDVTVRDTLGGMLVAWDKLPAKPWYTGIRVSKSRSATGDYFVMDTLPPGAASWMDTKVLGGTVYYYKIEPLVYDLPTRPNTVPTLVSGIKKLISEKMIAPQGLKLSLTPEKNIRLSWMADATPGLFAYYVFRGTSPDRMEVVSPPVFDTAYTDSLTHLDPGTTYLYAIAARDMNMTWSDTSEPVSMVCPVNETVAAPAGLSARYTEHGVRLFWNDVSQVDEKVIGYILYRRKKGEEYFKPLMTQPWKGHTYTDSLINVAGFYEYGCASMDARGNQSFLSSLAETYIPGSTYLYPPPGFDLKNSPAGIVVSIPPSLDLPENRIYVIYKRTPEEDRFTETGTMPVQKAVFVDRNVKKGILYVYAVSLRQQASESEKSAEKAIRCR